MLEIREIESNELDGKWLSLYMYSRTHKSIYAPAKCNKVLKDVWEVETLQVYGFHSGASYNPANVFSLPLKRLPCYFCFSLAELI